MGFFGTLGKIAGGIAGGVGGFFTGGPAGAIGGALAGSGLVGGGGAGRPGITSFPFPGGTFPVGIGPMGPPVVPIGGRDPCPEGTRCCGGLTQIAGELFARCDGDCVPAGQPCPSTAVAGTVNGKCPTVSCQLPTGRAGRTNRSRYFKLSSRCADPSNPSNYTLIPPNTRCVKPRSTNFANRTAAKRAIRRLEGHHRHLKRTQEALDAIVTKKRRKKRA